MRILIAITPLLTGCNSLMKDEDVHSEEDCVALCNQLHKDMDTYFGAPDRAICVCSPNTYKGKEL
jgi:hypothetical protein